MAWQSRMQWELKQLVNSPPPGVVVWPEGESLARLQAQVEGPPDTVYEGGVFRLDIQIPERYPHEPPKVRFVTRVYHPNVTPETGLICLSTLNLRPKGDWTPATNLSTLMTTIRVLLSAPNPDDGLVAEITDQFKQNRAVFDATAREWTACFAKPGLVDPAEAAGLAVQLPAASDAPESSAGPSPRPCEPAAAHEPAEAEAVAPVTSAAPEEASASRSTEEAAGVQGRHANGRESGGAAAEPASTSVEVENVPPPEATGAAKRPLADGGATDDAGAQGTQQPLARKRRMQLSRPAPVAASEVPAGHQGEPQGE